jgi:hypothetical protein
MRSRKASLAILLLMTLVVGGVLISLNGPSASQAPEYGPAANQPIATTTAAAGAAGGFLGFGSSNGSHGTPFGAVSSTTTLTTTVVAAGATVTTTVSSRTISGPGPTVVVQPNSPQGQQPQPKTGASLSTSNATGGRDIEFFTNLTLQAPSASSSFAKATALAYSSGGYVAFSTETNATALVVLRIPASSYGDALPQVEALGTLVSLQSSSNDVTVQYTDLNATLASLQAEQASLLKILGQSTNINSTLNVESRIQGVDQQINAVQSEILQTRTLISYATISVFIEEKAPVQPLTIRVTATPRSGNSPLSVTFNAVTKGGSQPYIVNYNFGDGSSYEGQALIHTFQQAGHYNVTVTATDASANVAEAWTVVDVSAPPASLTVGGFPTLIASLFLQVVEGMAEIAVVVIPILMVLLVILFPLRYRLGLSSKKSQQTGNSAAQ